MTPAQLTGTQWARRTTDTIRTVVKAKHDGSLTAQDQDGSRSRWDTDYFLSVHDRIPEIEVSSE